MTKSRGIGRGGKRLGSGRKSGPSALQIAAEKGETFAVIEPGGPVETAASLKELALATLKQIMTSSEKDAARVAAAKEVLARAADEDSPDTGKKAQRQANAQRKLAAGGKFSAPLPPMAVRQMQ